jgi:hypothetical protein
MRLTTRGLAQHGGPPGWLEESDPAGVILYVMDGPYRLPFSSCELKEFPTAFKTPSSTSRGRLWAIGAGIFKQSMGARNRVGIGLSYRPARLHRLAESIPWNRFKGP